MYVWAYSSYFFGFMLSCVKAAIHCSLWCDYTKVKAKDQHAMVHHHLCPSGYQRPGYIYWSWFVVSVWYSDLSGKSLGLFLYFFWTDTDESLKEKNALVSDLREWEPAESRRHSAAINFHFVAGMFPLLGHPHKHRAPSVACQAGTRGRQVSSHPPFFIISFFKIDFLMILVQCFFPPNQFGPAVCEDLHACPSCEYFLSWFLLRVHLLHTLIHNHAIYMLDNTELE